MFIEELFKDQRFFMAVVITVVLSICLHELAHGLVAVWLGDRTPIEKGHMTLNPAIHMGVFSAITLLLAGIAWGSMPVDDRRLRGKYAAAWVALAGPAMNVLLGTLAILAVGLWQRFDPRSVREMAVQLENLRYLLWVFGLVNLQLAIFNLIPIPPLDGSRVLSTLSDSYAKTIEMITMGGGFIILMIAVFSFAGKITGPIAREIGVAMLKIVRGY